jgi:hypothetical protein
LLEDRCGFLLHPGHLETEPGQGKESVKRKGARTGRKGPASHHLNKGFETVSDEYGMIEPGTGSSSGVSGGTDSMSLYLLRTPKNVIPATTRHGRAHRPCFDGSGETGELEDDPAADGCDFVIDRTDIGPWPHSE